MNPNAPPGKNSSRLVAAAPARPLPYLRVPDRLLRTCAHDQLAVGVYLAVARCALAERGPVTISAADLAAWEGGVRRRAALIRRIRALLDDGWLVAERGGNVKLRLLPTWGSGADGAPLLWCLRDSQLGKLADTRVRRIPLDLLDLYLGRLDPQPGRRPAVITRYFDRPLIDLADLGAYAITLATALPSTERLVALGLATSAEVQPPRSLVELLADAEAGLLRLKAHGVTVIVHPSSFGRQRLERGAEETAVPSDDQRQVWSDSRSESVSDSASESPSDSRSDSPTTSYLLRPSPAAGRARVAVREQTAAYAWESRDRRIEGMQTPPPRSRVECGGGHIRAAWMNGDERATLDAGVEQQLRAMGVRHPAALAGVDPTLIAQWQAVVAHPGMRARFTDPLAFAITQMRQDLPPPDEIELMRWHQKGESRGARMEHYPLETATPGTNEQHTALVARARAIAPANATPLDLAQLLSALAAGASEAEALAQFADEPMPTDDDQEVYRALIARAGGR